MPSAEFPIGSTTFTFRGISVGVNGTLQVIFAEDIPGRSTGDPVLTTAQEAALRLHVCDGTTTSVIARVLAPFTPGPTLDWSPPVVTRTVYLSLPANHAATGEPAITGTAQAGQELTADASPIMDADGVPSSFTYKWFRVDADGTSNEADISDARPPPPTP